MLSDDFHADSMVSDRVHEVQSRVREAWSMENLVSVGTSGKTRAVEHVVCAAAFVRLCGRVMVSHLNFKFFFF